MIVVGISLYMYLLYKEVKVFQDEIVLIKAQIAQMQMASLRPPPYPSEDKEKVCEIKTDIIDNDNDIDEDDDNHSVTSNEIKNILTNIQENDENEDEELETDNNHNVVTEIKVEKQQDLSSMTEEELMSQKYEVLREYLRAKKKSIKGTKAELIKRILEI